MLAVLSVFLTFGTVNKVMNLNITAVKKKKEYYETWEEASVSAQNLGIQTYRDYRKRYTEDSKLPSSGPLSRLPGFPGWHIFLNHIFPPKGWRNWNFLLNNKDLTGTVSGELLDFLKLCKKTRPDFFANYWGKSEYEEYYHPGLVKIIFEIFTARKPPSGWMSASKILAKAGLCASPKDRKALSSIVNRLDSDLKKNRIKDFHVKGHLIRHFSPLLSKKILSKLKLWKDSNY